jgi:hypothetical protein
MAAIVSTLVFLYLVTALYYFNKSSLPLESCTQSSCIKPFLYANTSNGDIDSHDEVVSHLLLELYVPSLLIQKDHNQHKNQIQWTLVSNCTLQSNSDVSTNVTNATNTAPATLYFNDLSTTSTSKQNDNAKNKRTPGLVISSPHPNIKQNCYISFPNFIRERSKKEHLMKSFKGKLVLKRIRSNNDQDDESKLQQQNERIIAETLFDLTRVIFQSKSQEYVPFYKYYNQRLVLRVVTDPQSYPIHNPVRGDGHQLQYVYSKVDGQYYHRPIFYVDDVALQHSSQIQLAPPSITADEETKPPVKLSIKISFVTPLRHITQQQLSLSMQMAEKMLRPNELDEIKYFLSDEYMYKFIITQIIGFLHLFFDYLAFKNEIGFYVGRGKDVTGISLSSIYSRFICDVIIFLYLLEGNNTSWFVLMGIGLSIVVELWKLMKFLQPKLDIRKFPFFVSFRDLSSLTSTEKLTVDYDGIARTYLSLILYPLTLGLALYGRQFYAYKSWYSWAISNLANAVYTFGFISLCPQLYINYRLKSVAHMPWRVFMYKIFNTFVDDVFAVLIEMPMKHKIMTLRDDVVFVIFLIQAYIYRVDKTRANEFGYVYEVEETKQEISSESDEIQIDEQANTTKSVKVD